MGFFMIGVVVFGLVGGFGCMMYFIKVVVNFVIDI